VSGVLNGWGGKCTGRSAAEDRLEREVVGVIVRIEKKHCVSEER